MPYTSQISAGSESQKNYPLVNQTEPALAEIEGRPAAMAILFLHERVAYFADTCVHPDYRGRRLQSALLARFKRDAAQLGADLLCSQASFGSTSHRNIERAGLRLLYTQAEWTRPQRIAADINNSAHRF